MRKVSYEISGTYFSNQVGNAMRAAFSCSGSNSSLENDDIHEEEK